MASRKGWVALRTRALPEPPHPRPLSPKGARGELIRICWAYPQRGAGKKLELPPSPAEAATAPLSRTVMARHHPLAPSAGRRGVPAEIPLSKEELKQYRTRLVAQSDRAPG